jgi:gag-polypeptide of LTR copia-type/Zinc knuckle
VQKLFDQGGIMVSDSASKKGVKLPSFDGDSKKFQLWWTRFCAYATVYKFRQALAENGDSELQATEGEEPDESTAVGKKMIAAKKRNEVAMVSFTMAFTTEVVMGLVYKASTTAWPSGLAKIVVQGLLKKYRPLDIVSLVELRQRMNKVTMKKGADPSTLFEQLSAIENQFSVPGTPMDESHMIAVILDAATDEYQAVISTERRIRGDKMSVMDLEVAMSEHYRQLSRVSGGKKQQANSGGDSEHEVVLAGFGGVCYHCNKPGHKANKCPEKTDSTGGNNKKNAEANKGGKFQGKCNNCGKVGHREVDCWEKEGNKAKRPTGYKTAKERGTGSGKAASAVDGGNKTEFCCADLPFRKRLVFWMIRTCGLRTQLRLCT